MCSNCPETRLKNILGRFLACVKERKKETLRKKEGKKEREKKDKEKRQKERKNERRNERTDGRTNARTNESTLARLLDKSCFFVCRGTVVIVVVKV